MIVVDTNVICYALIWGDRTDLALRVERLDPNWKVPPLWRHEFLNVLATSARAGVIGAEQAEAILRRALDLLIPAESAVDMVAALRLAVEHGISTYDAEYMSLALALQVRCVTEDGRLQTRFPETAVSMAAFCR